MTTSSFDGHRWPSPDLTVADAAAVARNWWGLEGEVRALESNQDQNFHIQLTDGRQVVLKVANPRTPPGAVQAQNQVLTELARDVTRHSTTPWWCARSTATRSSAQPATRSA